MSKKKEKYRLEPLLIVKEKHKKQCEIELSKAIRRVNEEKKRLEELEEERLKIIDQKKLARIKMSQHAIRGESKIYDSSLHLNYLEKLQDDLVHKESQIEHQKQVITQAEENVKKARRHYIDASQDLKTMEKHKELWAKALRAALEYQEQKEMNELSNVIFQMNKGKR